MLISKYQCPDSDHFMKSKSQYLGENKDCCKGILESSTCRPFKFLSIQSTGYQQGSNSFESKMTNIDCKTLCATTTTTLCTDLDVLYFGVIILLINRAINCRWIHHRENRFWATVSCYVAEFMMPSIFIKSSGLIVTNQPQSISELLL